ncbi:thiol reductant ABC exporter subunit CydC [Saccharibacillus sp. O23]|uniref:thiol reductant ABC exporter subunit CydC n=1 Tax=Saccharibacillus sp. O23 TaxID=2009338 RepID=UPI000B4E26E0|nr:thiol reductant ABC exporter subunit CydC [Saccharibacillus sp. O23]OWR30449.1 thiol reductant ABC exporter subunit CydC [Saccharibacillus sp. O23]
MSTVNQANEPSRRTAGEESAITSVRASGSAAVPVRIASSKQSANSANAGLSGSSRPPKPEGWIAPYLRAHALRFAAIIALGALTVLAAGMLTFTSGFLISKSALRPENILMVYVPIVGVRTFGIARSVLRYVERLSAHDAVLRVLSKMRVRLYGRLEPQALQLRSRYRTGDLLGLMSDDVEKLQDVYVRSIFPGVTALLAYAVVVLALGWFDWAFALLTALYLLVLVAVVPFVSLRITRRNQIGLKRAQSALYARLTDAVLGLGDWTISGRGREFAAAYEQGEREAGVYERRLSAWTRRRALITQMSVGLLVLIVAVWAAGQLADRSIPATLLAAFVLVVVPLSDAFTPMADAVNRIPSYTESLNRLNALDQAEETEESSIPAVPAEAAARMARDAHIRIRGMDFRYLGSGERAVRDLDLDIPQGKRIAIIGRSGSGKSTLLKLIQGVYAASSGSLTFNGLSAHLLGGQMPKIVSVLNQSPHLFDTTIQNNIRLGREDASDEEVREAARRARLGELIDSLPQGSATPMREAGARFSGGERQRVALARVLLQATPVLLLDEPTVGLDPRTESALLRTLLAETEGKTLIWATHHLVAAEQMDEILFMDEGRIVLRGTHAELMASSERYRNLYRLDRPWDRAFAASMPAASESRTNAAADQKGRQPVHS